MSERPGPEAEAFSLNFRLVIVKIGAVSGVLQIGVVQYCRVELCRVEYCRVEYCRVQRPPLHNGNNMLERGQGPHQVSHCLVAQKKIINESIHWDIVLIFSANSNS